MFIRELWGKTRRIRFEGDENIRNEVFTFEQGDDHKVNQLLWPSSIRLSQYLCSRMRELENHEKEKERERKVLELGCGACALVSEVASCLAYKVVMGTDTEETIGLVRPRNGFLKATLDWTDLEQAKSLCNEHGKFDLILGADILYKPQLLPGLGKTIDACLNGANPDAYMLLCFQIREPGSEEFFLSSILELHGLKAHELRESDEEMESLINSETCSMDRNHFEYTRLFRIVKSASARSSLLL